MFDTIAAIATAIGHSGVAVVRISGDRAVSIVDAVVDIDLMNASARELLRAAIYSDDDLLDQGLVCKMIAPNSFTGEDVVEIHCHGGVAAPRAVLSALIAAGARMAEAGEFTRRAFLNGKIDLTKAEAIADIIEAGTESSLKLSAWQLSGGLKERISDLRGRLLAITAGIVAVVDFPEEVGELGNLDLGEILHEAEGLLSTASSGKMMTSGFNVTILGAPNVGKSSLMNCILGEDRAIVTDIAGTTRDVICESANIDGFKVNLHDCAGIRDTQDVVEQAGIRRAIDSLAVADLVLVVLDSSRETSEDDEEILRLSHDYEHIIVRNKKDINPDGDISTITGEGIDALLGKITQFCEDRAPKGGGVITNARQEAALTRAVAVMRDVQGTITGGVPYDVVLGDLEVAIEALGEITGDTVRDEIIDEVFSHFCLGK